MKKYDEGLSDVELDKMIEGVGELIPKEDESSKYQLVIVDGYIFEIDRSVPKVIEIKGKADDIIITARLSNAETNGWIKPSESEAKITGTIKTYSGGKLTNVSATKNGVPIVGFSIDENGKYEIRVAESGTYKITAEDSKNKKKEKEIETEIKIDNIKPTVDSIIATPEGKKIKLSATGTDNESGIDYFSYTIIPESGVTPTTGKFKKNETVEISITNWVIYTIKVTATDKCENVSETAEEIQVDMTDTIAPKLDNILVESDQLEIKISATATDDKSGVKEFNYTITPTTGLSKSTGTFKEGETVTVKSTQEKTYTVSITVTDNNNNTSTPKTKDVTTIDGLTIAQAKERVNKDTLQKYIGTKIVDYNAEGIWRIFYQDNEKQGNGKGYFGDEVGTIYLKRDHVSNDTTLTNYKSYAPSDGGAMMKQMNPKWRNSAYSDIDLENEHCVSWLCDPAQWTKYKTSQAKYAIGSPSVEMYMKAYNAYIGNNSALVCKIENETGYMVGANNSYAYDSGLSININTIQSGKGNVFTGSDSAIWWLSSPSAWWDGTAVLWVDGTQCQIEFYSPDMKLGVCPIVSLKN